MVIGTENLFLQQMIQKYRFLQKSTGVVWAAAMCHRENTSINPPLKWKVLEVS